MFCSWISILEILFVLRAESLSVFPHYDMPLLIETYTTKKRFFDVGFYVLSLKAVAVQVEIVSSLLLLC